MGWLPLVAAVVMGQGGASIEAAPDPSGQTTRPDPRLEEPVQVEDVEVFGRRGAALTPPEIELDGADIDALDAWSIDDVLKRMDETLALGGQPLVLINGRPTPNVSAYTGFPPDALVRAEVLPPEAAGLYGAAPGQRVVNLVLQQKFSSYDGRAVASRPTQGGTSTLSGDLRRSAIAGSNTHQFGVRVSRDTALRAGERDRALATDGPEADRVTLRPQSELLSANLSLTRGLGDWSGVFSLNGQTQDSRSVAQVGVGVVESRRRSDSLGASGGASGKLAGWLVQTNLNGQAARNEEDGLQDMTSDTLSFGWTGSGQRSLMELPSGPLTASVNANFQGSRSTVERDQDRTVRSFQTRSARGALTLPLSKAGGEDWADRLGDLSASFGAGMRESGGGSGEDVSAGLSWTPRRGGVRINGEWATSTDSVPDIQRSEPRYYGTPVVVFDFRTGEAVEVLPIRGGNPDLTPPESERWTASASLGPFTSWALSGNLGYMRTEFTNGIGALPELTEDVEAAFPDRFERDIDGRLVSIDYRPLNLSSTLNETLNTGVNFNLPRPAGAAGQEATVMRVALNHSLQLSNVTRLRAGLPELDRLKGDGGGVSQQNASVLLDARRGRWGANISARWQEGYRTRRNSGVDGPDDLVMAAFTTVDLRFNFQMTSSRNRTGEGAAAAPRRRSAGLQLNLDISNLFDARREARLGDGSPAQGYGRDMQDPLGRTVRLTLQRRF